jgi:hypothetical protein
MTLKGRLGRVVRPFAPGLVDAVAAAAVRRGK